MGADDGETLAELYPAVRRLAGIIAPAGTAPDDLVQEVFTRVFERGGLTGIERPLPYLRRALANLVLNERRHDRAAQRAFARHGVSAEGDDPTYPSDLAELLRMNPRARLLVYLVDV